MGKSRRGGASGQMRGLTDDEARVLRPFGPPGEFIPDVIVQALIARGLGRWDSGRFWEPTEMGWLALRIYDRIRGGL